MGISVQTSMAAPDHHARWHHHEPHPRVCHLLRGVVCAGETKLANEHPVNVDPKLEALGFQDGDRILGYNGETLRYYGDLRMEASTTA